MDGAAHCRRANHVHEDCCAAALGYHPETKDSEKSQTKLRRKHLLLVLHEDIMRNHFWDTAPAASIIPYTSPSDLRKLENKARRQQKRKQRRRLKQEQAEMEAEKVAAATVEEPREEKETEGHDAEDVVHGDPVEAGDADQRRIDK